MMKLVDSVEQVSKMRDEQENEIRKLKADIKQQQADFEALTIRVVNDKNQLYQELEKLKMDNETLTLKLEKQKEEESLMLKRSAQLGVNEKTKRNGGYRQKQQVPVFYQEMQEELGKCKRSHQES